MCDKQKHYRLNVCPKEYQTEHLLFNYVHNYVHELTSETFHLSQIDLRLSEKKREEKLKIRTGNATNQQMAYVTYFNISLSQLRFYV